MTNLIIKKLNKRNNPRQALSSFSGIFGMICNALLCIIKFSIGTISGSVSITADALNNLSDAGTSLVTIVGGKLSNRPVDKEHPFGHGRIEYISALIISFFIFIMGFELAKSSIEKILNPSQITFNIWYIIALLAAIIVKLYMAYFNSKLYKETNNINLKAVMQDSLNDCLATTATIVALVISSLTSFKIADGIIGIIVAIVIFASGINIVKDITGKLLGQAPDAQLVKEIENMILSANEIVGVHDLIIHDYGVNRIIASAHAEVPSNVDIVKIHDVIDNIEREISEKLNIIICIHTDPIVINDERIEHYKNLAQCVINKINSEYTFHDFKVVEGDSHTNLIFDLVVPHSKTKSIDILNQLKKEFTELDSKINLVVTIEHSFI